MYDYIPYICAAVFFFLGLFMTLMPKQAIKKEERNSEIAIKKARKNGIILTILAIFFILLLIVVR